MHVFLLWRPLDDALTVSVEDSRVGERVELIAERSSVELDVFCGSPSANVREHWRSRPHSLVTWLG